jgi:hypothetical protein
MGNGIIWHFWILNEYCPKNLQNTKYSELVRCEVEINWWVGSHYKHGTDQSSGSYLLHNNSLKYIPPTLRE